MNIDALLSPSAVLLNFNAKNKTDALEQLTRNFTSLYPGVDQKKLLQALMKREELGSTAIGSGIAIPHADSGKIAEPKGLLAVSRNGIDFTALDGGPVHFLFLIVCPQNSAGKHLLTLAMAAKLLLHREKTREKYPQIERQFSSNSPDMLLVVRRRLPVVERGKIDRKFFLANIYECMII